LEDAIEDVVDVLELLVEIERALDLGGRQRAVTSESRAAGS
jgi:hypothetical protein